ncbi:hypothetical protein CPT03_12145 [Pedobacter ginsengisoli]|uniref:Uncharacterized protein n=1 Tax=Pedobacter ginsengisoli TaxID=363852 RepID=A0A2D1U6E7_9SPHI|nr:hypothetical protein [Pedobacter ginsengisoli]ATP57168.1 hypothetical protein CPT03_12145 [Pedobacter ginsengisoli]
MHKNLFLFDTSSFLKPDSAESLLASGKTRYVRVKTELSPKNLRGLWDITVGEKEKPIPSRLNGKLSVVKDPIKQSRGWRHLFNHKNLNSWHALPDAEWKVENGTILNTETLHGIFDTSKSRLCQCWY